MNDLGLTLLTFFIYVILVTLYDAEKFPRTEDGGTPESQKAFHSRLWRMQVLGFSAWGLFALYQLGPSGWPVVLAGAVFMLWAVHDIVYWFWRILFKRNTYADWNPWGDWLYAKPTNLGWLFHAAWREKRWPWMAAFGWEPEKMPKYIDTRWRIFGLALAALDVIAYVLQ